MNRKSKGINANTMLYLTTKGFDRIGSTNASGWNNTTDDVLYGLKDGSGSMKDAMLVVNGKRKKPISLSNFMKYTNQAIKNGLVSTDRQDIDSGKIITLFPKK